MESIGKLAEKLGISKAEFAKRYFAEQGCELLGDYTGCMDKVPYRCKCKRIAETSWNRFSTGRRCGYCSENGRKRKYTLEEVRNIFKDRGCVLLSTEYKNAWAKLSYICKCGREASICLAAFTRQNQYCMECGKEKNKGSGHHDWRPDREQKRLDDLFRKKCYKALRSTLKATGKDKVGKTTALLGYTPKELQDYIKSHPNWNKVKDANWHLDHIFPITAFIEHGITDIKIINCLENLQPLTEFENISKSGDYDKSRFLAWLEKYKAY